MGESQIIALIWVARISGIISLIGSSSIIFDMSKKKHLGCNRNDNKVPTRVYIIFLMSVADLISSFTFYVLGPIMAPKGLGWGTYGTDATCTAQGYIGNVFWGSSQFYSALLALYYMLSVRFQWKEDRFKTPCCRFWFLVFPIPFFVGYSIWPLTDGAHNFNGSMSCFLNKYPLGCGEEGDKCTRGLNFGTIYMVSCIFIGISAFVIILSMIMLWQFVVETENTSNRYAFRGSNNERNQSKKIAKVGIMYSACFIMTYLPWFVGVCFILAGQSRPYWALIISFIFLPLQGFFNALVYFYRNDQSMFANAWGALVNMMRSLRLSITNTGLGADESNLATSVKCESTQELELSEKQDTFTDDA